MAKEAIHGQWQGQSPPSLRTMILLRALWCIHCQPCISPAGKHTLTWHDGSQQPSPEARSRCRQWSSCSVLDHKDCWVFSLGPRESRVFLFAVDRGRSRRQRKAGGRHRKVLEWVVRLRCCVVGVGTSHPRGWQLEESAVFYRPSSMFRFRAWPLTARSRCQRDVQMVPAFFQSRCRQSPIPVLSRESSAQPCRPVAGMRLRTGWIIGSRPSIATHGGLHICRCQASQRSQNSFAPGQARRSLP